MVKRYYRESFRYLGLIILKDGEIKENVNHMVRVGSMEKRIKSIVVLFDHRVHFKLKGKIL